MYRGNAILFFLMAVPASSLAGQAIPENAHPVPYGNGWECNRGFVARARQCVSLRDATDAEVRAYLIDESIRAYSGSCRCPYNVDRGGRRC